MGQLPLCRPASERQQRIVCTNKKKGEEKYIIGDATASEGDIECKVYALIHEYPPKVGIFFDTQDHSSPGFAVSKEKKKFAAILEEELRSELEAEFGYGSLGITCRNLEETGRALKAAKKIVAAMQDRYAATNLHAVNDAGEPTLKMPKPDAAILIMEEYKICKNGSNKELSGKELRHVLKRLRELPEYMDKVLKNYTVTQYDLEAKNKLITALQEHIDLQASRGAGAA